MPTTQAEEIVELRRLEKQLIEERDQLRYERDGYYGEWQHALRQLEEIHASKMWKFWMATIATRRAVRHPLQALRTAVRATSPIIPAMVGKTRHFLLTALKFPLVIARYVVKGVARGAGLAYLVGWTLLNQLVARNRKTPSLRLEFQNPPPDPVIPKPEHRPRVLIVSPYALYPPNHGGGVRLFNLIRVISGLCDVYLLVFSINGEDEEQRRALEPFCARVDFHHWVPRAQSDFFGLTPPGAQLFASPRVSEKIRDIVQGFNIDVVQLEYTELGQYRNSVPAGVPVILTEHDVASLSFRRRRQRGFHRRYPEGNAFGSSSADWRRLFRYEILGCREVDQVHTMSEDDGDYLAPYLADGAERLWVVPNGVDTEYYREPENPPSRSDLLYVGNYQNLPNVDALEYFVVDIWPLLRLTCPDARLSVVGANPSQRVMQFDGRDGISVVGPVDDLREAYHRHRVMLAPIRAGSGTRLKILEAFAAGIPVVSTSLGAEGIDAQDGTHLLIADNAVDFSRAVDRLLTDDSLHASVAAAALELVTERYDWKFVADRLYRSYVALTPPGASANTGASETAAQSPAIHKAGVEPKISIIIPTLNGGAELARCLENISDQKTDHDFEVLCIDSQSDVSDLDEMKRHGARVVPINRMNFNHGLTRDLGAREAGGELLVFLNQDAVPADHNWLENLVKPLKDGGDRVAAVQGGIHEIPGPEERFYWDSCGDRFYFTRESNTWIADHGGIGFSTVNCAIPREVWLRYPFGWAPIMEDKKWQREVTDAGFNIVFSQEALVYHTHNYDMAGLLNRCRSEGYGWRLLGARYSFFDMTRDMMLSRVYADLVTGLRTRQIHSAAEFFFPWLRPMALFWGNHVQRRVVH